MYPTRFRTPIKRRSTSKLRRAPRLWNFYQECKSAIAICLDSSKKKLWWRGPALSQCHCSSLHFIAGAATCKLPEHPLKLLQSSAHVLRRSSEHLLCVSTSKPLSVRGLDFSCVALSGCAPILQALIFLDV